MNLTKQQKYAVGAIASVAAVVGTYFIFRTPPLKALSENDETINAVQGHAFTVRFPRGDYSVASPDLKIQAQNSIGDETHVVLVAPINPMGEVITIHGVLVEQDSGRPFPVKIVARPVSAYGEVPTRNPPQAMAWTPGAVGPPSIPPGAHQTTLAGGLSASDRMRARQVARRVLNGIIATEPSDAEQIFQAYALTDDGRWLLGQLTAVCMTEKGDEDGPRFAQIRQLVHAQADNWFAPPATPAAGAPTPPP